MSLTLFSPRCRSHSSPRIRAHSSPRIRSRDQVLNECHLPSLVPGAVPTQLPSSVPTLVPVSVPIVVPGSVPETRVLNECHLPSLITGAVPTLVFSAARARAHLCIIRFVSKTRSSHDFGSSGGFQGSRTRVMAGCILGNDVGKLVRIPHPGALVTMYVIHRLTHTLY